jgi:hypothetical protein
MADYKPDTASISAQGTLDGLFGTAGQALSLWSQWNDKKADNLERKTAIPPSVSAPSPKIDGAAINTKTWTMIGAGIAALGVVLFLFRRK